MRQLSSFYRFIFLGFVIILSGCASIVTGYNQPLSVETHHKGNPVTGVRCKLTNDKGSWFVTTPGSIVVRRAYSDLRVVCDKERFPTTRVAIKSKTKAMAAGNILFGGLVGVGVDAATGAAYDYPDVIRINMGAP